jgi:hypothetical protein
VSISKRIVCLANSRKLQGRCVAGRELQNEGPGPWIRPVSDRPSEEVSEEERRYQDGSDPKILDVIDVPLIAARPKGYQQENWLLDPQTYWVKRGRSRWEDLAALQDRAGPLWLNGFSSYNGVNDRIPLTQAMELMSSLKLIHVNNLSIRVFAPGEAFRNTKRRVQANFSFDRTDYALWVTDPIVERQYLAQPDADYPLRDVYLTVSIGEPYQDYCYKLVATVITRT